jgi:hypothetical protein
VVAARYRILLLVGDDLGDFLSGAKGTVAERTSRVAPYTDFWGAKWIALPNPSYVSWEQAITASVKARLDKAVANKRITSAQEQKLLKALSTGIDAMVNNTLPKGPRFGGPGPGYQRAFKGRFPRPGSFTPAAPAPGAPALGAPAPAGPFA